MVDQGCTRCLTYSDLSSILFFMDPEVSKVKEVLGKAGEIVPKLVNDWT